MFNCRFASIAHRIFAFKLELLVDGNDVGECDPDSVADPARCDLGKWLAAHAAELGHLARYAELEGSHRRFHEIAGEMTRLFVAGDVAGARSLGQTGFKAASEAVLAALEEMGDEIDQRR